MQYKNSVKESIFSLMELTKQQYHDVIFMPVKRFYDLIKWKSDLEEERKKLMKEQEEQLRKESKQRRK